MKHIISALSLAAILVPAPGLAQDAAAPVDSCQRAWTSSDWTTVAADCSTVAQSHENNAETRILELQTTGSAGVERDVNGLIGLELLIAGEARTREAVAYNRLG